MLSRLLPSLRSSSPSSILCRYASTFHPGSLSIDNLKKKVHDGEVETVCVAFTDHIGRLMGKRFHAQTFVDSAYKSGTHACNYLLTVDINNEPGEGFDVANWELGFGDFHLVPDLETLRMAAWLPKTAYVLCNVSSDRAVVDPTTKSRATISTKVNVAPRQMLLDQLSRLSSLDVEGYGTFSADVASELEYYTYKNSYKEGNDKGWVNLTPNGWVLEDYHMLQGTRQEILNAPVRSALSKSGIYVEGTKGEFGKGQHELNILYADALEMADAHVLAKQCTKEIADKLGLSVTFMAKPSEEDAGSSCHIHLNLAHTKDGKKKNAFAGDQELGPGIYGSDIFKWFVGGWLKHMSETIVFYAPTINSYKRFQSGSWAPTSLTWSADNRTAGFRVVGHDQSLRVECRIGGADCNPYLAFSAAIAAGLDGIKNKIEPPSQFSGNAYGSSTVPMIPMTLKDATKAFESSTFAKEAFGEDVVKHYATLFKHEVASYDKAVTDWEKKRYFEQI